MCAATRSRPDTVAVTVSRRTNALRWHLARRKSGCRHARLATIRRLSVRIAATSRGSFGRLNRSLSVGRFYWSASTLWLIGTFVFRFSDWLCFDQRSSTQTKYEDVTVSKSVHVDVGCAINPGVSKMLATVFTAVLFAVSFVPAGNAEAAASARPTCCAKHAYCCTVHAACCGDRASTQTTDELANVTSQPTCCAKRAYCCSVNARCCGKHAETKAAIGDVVSDTGQPTCCAKRAYCCSVGAACCGKGSSSSTEVESADCS